MTLSPTLEGAMLALQPAMLWPLQDAAGAGILDVGLSPRAGVPALATVPGVPAGTGLGVGRGFPGGANSDVTATTSWGNTTPQGMSVWFRITNLPTADQMLFYHGSNNAGNGWGLAFNHTGNGHLWILCGGLAWHDLGLVIADNLWHSVYVGLTNGTNFGVTLDGVYGFAGSFGWNAPSGLVTLGWDQNVGRTSELVGSLAWFAFYFGAVPSSPQFNTTIQAAQGVASSSIPSSAADIATLAAYVSRDYRNAP